MGNSGLTVSVVGLGCNNFGTRLDLTQSSAVVDAALDAGITLLDTADIYGDSEVFLGDVLKGRRDEVVLATKFGATTAGRVAPEHEARGSRRYIRMAVEASLRRLRTDWIDLYLIHRPDPLTPIDETLAALDDLVRAGLVRYVGCSNFSAAQLVEAQLSARLHGVSGFVGVQNEYSLVNREVERELLPLAERYGVGLIPYFPLANGLLSGKYVRGERPSQGRLAEPAKARLLSPELFDVVEQLATYARERDLTMVDVAIGALAARSGVTSVIAGATSAEQVRMNAAASRWRTSAADLAAIDAIAPA